VIGKNGVSQPNATRIPQGFDIAIVRSWLLNWNNLSDAGKSSTNRPFSPKDCRAKS